LKFDGDLKKGNLLATVIRRLPFFDDATSLQIPSGSLLSIKPRQIVVWLSIGPPGSPPPLIPGSRFPAVLDTGFNNSFLIQEEHLMAWCGFSLADFNGVAVLSAFGKKIPMIDADLWLHSNLPGHRDS